MSDDNKTNEELLEEVKRLRQLEEDRDTRRKEEAEKKKKKKALIGCITIMSIPIIFFVSIAIVSF